MLASTLDNRQQELLMTLKRTITEESENKINNTIVSDNDKIIHNNNNIDRNVIMQNINKKQTRIICKRGEIFYSDLAGNQGSEQGGYRPVIIIQNDIGNTYSPTTIVAVFTSQVTKAKLPTHLEISAEQFGLEKDSVILFEQIRTLDKKRLREKIGMVDEFTMRKVDKTLGVSVGLIVEEQKQKTSIEYLPKHIQDEINETLQYIYSYEKVLGRSQSDNLNHLLAERTMLLEHLEKICNDNEINYKEYYIPYTKERNIAVG